MIYDHECYLKSYLEDLIGREDVYVADTETSGFGKNAEVLAVTVLNTRGKVLLNGASLPQGPISPWAANVHGLTRRRLLRMGACSWPHLHERLSRLLGAASLVLAWNAPFDVRMLNQTARRHNLELPERPCGCVMRSYANARPGRPRGLAAAAADLGIPAPARSVHTALGDATTTLRVAQALAGVTR